MRDYRGNSNIMAFFPLFFVLKKVIEKYKKTKVTETKGVIMKEGKRL